MFRSSAPIRPFCCCLCLIITLLTANFCLSASADGLLSREGLLGIEQEQLQLFDWKRRIRSIGGPSTGSDSSSSSSSSEETPEGSGQEEREERRNSELPSSPTPPEGSLQQSAMDRGEGTNEKGTESPEENSATEQRRRRMGEEEEKEAEGGGEEEGSGEQ